MAGHTAGPWFERFGDVYALSGQVIPHWGDSWEAPERFVSESERDANAHLIAAAPELLEAAESASAWLERWATHVGGCNGGSICTCGLTLVRHETSSAIAKATQP